MATKAKTTSEVVDTGCDATFEGAATAVPAKAAPKTAPAKARTFSPTDEIICRSITHGELVLEGRKTKMLYTWANDGDIAHVEYQDLQALQSMKSRFLTEPLFIIEDDDLIQKWNLGQLYSKIEYEDLDKLLKLTPAQLKSKLKTAPDGIKKSVKSAAAAKILNGELDSLSRIKVIDEILGTDLISMIS